MIRQLENSIEKMHMKIHAGQKVTTLYLALRDVLKRVSCPSLSPLCDRAAPLLRKSHGGLFDPRLMGDMQWLCAAGAGLSASASGAAVHHGWGVPQGGAGQGADGFGCSQSQ